MRRPATNILLLVIFCLWSHAQPAAVQPGAVRRTRIRCTGKYIHICAGKRSNIGDLAQATNIEADGERSDREEAREGERRGDGGRESGGLRDSGEGDDLRSESSDRKQLSEERELDDIGKRRHSPTLDSELGRLRSLLKKTVSDVDDREEGPPSISTNTNRSYVVNDTWTMLEKILAAIESELILQPANSDSESGKRYYEEDDEDN